MLSILNPQVSTSGEVAIGTTLQGKQRCCSFILRTNDIPIDRKLMSLLEKASYCHKSKIAFDIRKQWRSIASLSRKDSNSTLTTEKNIERIQSINPVSCYLLSFPRVAAKLCYNFCNLQNGPYHTVPGPEYELHGSVAHLLLFGLVGGLRRSQLLKVI